MVGAHEQDPIDYEMLAQFMGALAYPLRLELLYQLRFPRTLGEIRVSTPRQYKGSKPGRTASRSTVVSHLETLIETGLVTTDAVERGGRQVPRYLVRPGRLYALIEELRRVSVLYAGRGVAPDSTGTLGSVEAADEPTGPRLLMVHGLYEGRFFTLDENDAVSGTWAIGRGDTCPVRIDYDPYVSQEHALIERVGDSFVLSDLGSKNGTLVNWQPVAPDSARALEPGDVLGVGLSRFSFMR